MISIFIFPGNEYIQTPSGWNRIAATGQAAASYGQMVFPSILL
jgi:hypothetical protein